MKYSFNAGSLVGLIDGIDGLSIDAEVPNLLAVDLGDGGLIKFEEILGALEAKEFASNDADEQLGLARLRNRIAILRPQIEADIYSVDNTEVTGSHSLPTGDSTIEVLSAQESADAVNSEDQYDGTTEIQQEASPRRKR